MQRPTPVRMTAYRSLLRCEKQSRYSNIELDRAIKDSDFNEADRALFTALLYGTIERRLTLDFWLAALTDRDYDTLAQEMKCILRLGAYQIFYLDRVPDYAAIDESVKLAHAVMPKAASFVNAVLRRFLRQKESLSYPDPIQDPIRYLSVRYSVSAQLCEMWLADYGLDRTEQILKASFSNPPLTLHTNTLRTTREALLSALQAQGIAAVPTATAPYGIRLLQAVAISDFEPLRQGLCFVQDEASQITAQMLDAKAGQTVLDACACPGGKSFAIAMQMQNQGTLYSCDLHANKLSLVQAGAQRLGITCLQTAEQNASAFCEDFRSAMDCVLCDVPCSGLGVLAKKPDLRYKSAQEWERLPQIQSAILQNCAHYVKPNGRLLYSTCTLNRRENEEVVEAFLAQNPLFSFEQMHTFFPDTEHTDGFFFCSMKKSTDA